MPSLTESRPPAQGQQHSYTMSPPPRPGCEVVWMIDGQAVSLHDEVGGLKVVGIGASGTITVEVTGDISGTRVSARVDCPNEAPVTFGPMAVGSGTWTAPCEEEPCKSARAAYNDAAIAAQQERGVVDVACFAYRFYLRVAAVLTAHILLIVAAAFLCYAQSLNPLLCQALYGIAGILYLMLAVISAQVVRSANALRLSQGVCTAKSILMQIAYLRMQRDCPAICWLPEWTVDCSCSGAI